MRLAVLALALTATAASAGVEEAVSAHVLPATQGFADAAEALEEAADTDCTADAVRPAWNDAFDAWLGLSHLRFGPLEEDSRALTIAFWPDTRGMTPRALGGLVADEDPVIESAEGFAEVSVAARGLYAMERLLYSEDYAGYGAEDYVCGLVRAEARDLARSAALIAEDWAAFAMTVRDAGNEGNDTFLSERESRQAFYTALVTGLDFVADQRLGRPLGSFDDPRPDLAETQLSGRALRNVTLSLEALQDLAATLGSESAPETGAAFDAALGTANSVASADLSGVSDPMQRVQVEALQQEVRDIRHAVSNEIGTALGVSEGFNATDGD
ncbi:signal peptidase [Roseivivax halodurans JCM 10272]|uniref:Signal peptidase n=2 Tax=Roseivivax halodurans TaxID=93683 RepID=X7EIA3_9RHOB|nr:imelysin family protein [Roseivivax halodurans]ETX15839.1 signal peptidase [Roseivivax halodurans JCM 10272]